MLGDLVFEAGGRPWRLACPGSRESTWTGVCCILGMRPSFSRLKSSAPPLFSMVRWVSVRWPSWV